MVPWSFSSQDEGRERGGGGGEGRAVLLPLVRQGPCDLHQSQTVPVSGRRVGSGWALRVTALTQPLRLLTWGVAGAWMAAVEDRDDDGGLLGA